MDPADPPGNGWSPWPAPAKLNLMLQVVGREPSGYHRLQTVFQLLDWGDTVWLRPRHDGRLVRHGPSHGIAESDELTLRAARALREATGAARGADIRVEKRIPQGGGFGGGSSDAATTLVGLDSIWGLGLGMDQLAELGLGLGADVPVFVRGHSAWAEGRGEVLTPIGLGPAWYVIVDPGVHVSTAELFQAADLTRDAPPATISDFVSGRCAGNAFQPLLQAREPRVAAALQALAAYGVARLTGTGGGCFVACDSRAAAESARRRLEGDWNVIVAAGVDRSPLLAGPLPAAGDNVATGASPSG